jgi:cytidine deaminase
MMNYLPENEAARLFEAARLASEKTYSPYSHYPVGAAVLMKDGSIFTGANVENASYSVTICAERVAIGSAITSGNMEITAIAVYANTDSISPCGACRQFIIEFSPDIIVIFRQDGKIIQRTISELLPFGFTKATMEPQNADKL